MADREMQDAGMLVDEARKIGVNHTKDGLKITFLVQPDDMPKGLWTAYIGTRYRMVLVEVDEQERPRPQQENVESRKLVASAQLLCREGPFQKHVLGDGYWSVPEHELEDATAERLRERLGVASRSELRTNEEAQQAFIRLRAAYLDARSRGLV